MIILIQNPSIVWISLFKHFQGYLGMFKDSDSYSATLTFAQLRGRREAALFEKSILIFERKAQIVLIYGLDFSFKM